MDIDDTRPTDIDHLPALVRVPDAAAALGISPGLVYTMARDGRLPSVRLGRLLRIPRVGLARMVGGDDARAR